MPNASGETDEKRKILFSGQTESRRQYVKSCVEIYSSLIDHLNTKEVKRIIAHPGMQGLQKKQNRPNI